MGVKCNCSTNTAAERNLKGDNLERKTFKTQVNM